MNSSSAVRIAIVVSRFNRAVTDNLLEGAREAVVRLGVACDEQGETGTERKQDVAKSDRPGGPGRSRGVSPNPRFAHAPFLHGASSRGQHREIP